MYYRIPKKEKGAFLRGMDLKEFLNDFEQNLLFSIIVCPQFFQQPLNGFKFYFYTTILAFQGSFLIKDCDRIVYSFFFP